MKMLTERGRPDRPNLVPGLLLAGLVAALSWQWATWPWLARQGLTALALALLLGMCLAPAMGEARRASCAPGLAVSRHQLLRWGVVLYGCRLTFQDVTQVGAAGVLIDALMLTLTFGLGRWVGVRWLGLDRQTATLVSAGSAICGAAAVLATAPVVRARDGQASVAVASVVLFGTVGMFLYPWLHAHLALVGGDPRTFGVYIGSTLHEVAQVVVAARAVDAPTLASAVITKMVRVMLLAPFLLALAARQPREEEGAAGDAGWHRRVPWFAFGFAGVVALHSCLALPAPLMAWLTQCDQVLLLMAMAALGLTTHMRDIRAAGWRPLLLGATLFVWLVVGGAVVNRGVRVILVSLT